MSGQSIQGRPAREIAAEVSAALAGGPLANAQLAWHSEYTSAAQIGWRIAELDRAVRRAAAGRRPAAEAPARIPRPVEGGLVFEDAAPGSADILFGLFGYVRELLTSDGVDTLLKAIALTGVVHRAWGFVFREKDPLRGVSGRQVLEILRQYGDLARAPVGSEPIGEPPGEDQRSATRITVLVEEADGTRVIVMLDTD